MRYLKDPRYCFPQDYLVFTRTFLFKMPYTEDADGSFSGQI